MDRIELLQGTLDMLILQTLQWGPQHGHGIGQAIRANSLDVLQIEHGSIQLSIASKSDAGFRPNGKIRKLTGAPNITS